MIQYKLDEFLARSTDKAFADTTLCQVLSNLPSLGLKGPWLGGGALRRTVQGQEPTSDFDFFFQCQDQLDAFAKELEAKGLKQIKKTDHHVHYRGTLGESKLERDIQLIKFKFYQSGEEVLNSFDYTICQLVYDGEQLSVGDHTLWDLGRKRLAINEITYPVSTMRRMLKYTSQGFTACSGCLAAIIKTTRDKPELNVEIEYVD